MSKNYDNWERVVAAVLRREELKLIALSSSLESSTINSVSSSISSPIYDQTPQLPNFEPLNNLSLERFLRVDKREVKAKHSLPEVLLQRWWRDLSGFSKIPKQLFRFTPNIPKSYEAAAFIRENKEKLRIVLFAYKAALRYIQAAQPSDNTVPKQVQASGSQICGDELGSIVEGHDVKKLKFHGGTSGISDKLATCPSNGLSTDSEGLNRRQEISCINKFQESEARSFWVFVWESLQNMFYKTKCDRRRRSAAAACVSPAEEIRRRRGGRGSGRSRYWLKNCCMDVAAGDEYVG